MRATLAFNGLNYFFFSDCVLLDYLRNMADRQVRKKETGLNPPVLPPSDFHFYCPILYNSVYILKYAFNGQYILWRGMPQDISNIKINVSPF